MPIDPYPLLSSLQDIKTELEDLKDRFIPRLNRCNEALMEILLQLETYVADEDSIFLHQDQYDKTSDETVSEINKLKDQIHEKLEEIKKLKDPIYLNHLNEKPKSHERDLSEDDAPQGSRDWLHLTIEQSILESPAMANIQMSYDVLDTQQKLCLLCLAIFPEKAVVKKKTLIYWWIGEGLISKSNDKSAEEVGEGVFMKLVDKGLIQPFHKSKDKKNPRVSGCSMHPWIRRMLIAVARTAEFFDSDDNSKNNVDNSSNSHRACLGLESNTLKEGDLFTVFNVKEHYLTLKTEQFLKIKKLVILQLGRWQTSAEHHIEVENDKFLNELWAQKHLRYLSLQGISSITTLPPSIAKCINLEILDLRACHNLEILRFDIGSLWKLTHLDVSRCYLLESMPKGIGKLSSLQVLKGFVIGHSRKSPCKLGDLVQLKKLRKLSIHIGSKAVIEEWELHQLEEIASLRVLTISWGKVALPSKNGEQVGTKTSPNDGASSSSQEKEGPKMSNTFTLTMEPFRFPPKLEKLDLRCFPSPSSPEWLKLSNMKELKRLYIRGGELVGSTSSPPKPTSSPPLLYSLFNFSDKEWKVKVLRLKYLKKLKIEATVLQKYFPNLVYFEKFECHQNVPQIGESTKDEMNVEWNNVEGWEALDTKLKSASTLEEKSKM